MKKIDLDKYFTPNLRQARRRSKDDSVTFNFQLDESKRKIGKNMKYHILTFGCQGNLADSEVMEGILQEMTFTKTEDEKDADIIILNTCAIRENAEDRVWGIVGRLKHLKTTNPDLIIGLAGCMPQQENVVNKVLKTYHHIDLVFGTHNIYKLPEYIETALYSKEKVIEVFSQEGEIIENLPKNRDNKYKAWVNIMYGCDVFCTYCIVPYTRGKERSRSKNEIINEITLLKEQGYQEVTLLGQNVNSYGLDFTSEKYTFGDLLIDVDKIGIPRIRFMTSHPHDLDTKTMKAMANAKTIMPYFHLPVQSGSDTVIKRMNRKYTQVSYLEKLRELRKHVPNISITTDIIVGFPGETEEDFQQTIDLVEKAKFDGAYTYIFSRREGTPAYDFLDETSIEVKNDRLQRLNRVININSSLANQKLAGKIVLVLVEGSSKKNDDVLAGHTETNRLVNFKGPRELIGKIIEVKITKAKSWSLDGELI